MAILDQLGINSSLILCFILFVVVITLLSTLVFSPFLKALEAREKNTKGGESFAEELKQQSEGLYKKFETKAREVNGEIKTVYDEYRAQAQKQAEEIIASARQESQKSLAEQKEKISIELKKAKENLSKESPAVAAAISEKMLMRAE